MNANEVGEVTQKEIAGIPPAYESKNFELIAYLLTLPGVTFATMRPVEQSTNNPGFGYRFMFAVVGRTLTDFVALEHAYLNCACTVEPNALLQKRKQLRNTMLQKIGELEALRKRPRV